jgi:hypothetical protein
LISSIDFFLPSQFIHAGEGTELERLLPEEDTTTSSSSFAEGLLSDAGDSDDFWEAFITSSSPVEKVATANNGFVARSKHVSQVEKDGIEGSKDESLELSNAQPTSSKPARRNKWKPEEVKQLINLRGKLNSRFQVLKGRMALWEEISGNLLSDGITRSAGECKSRWASLVQKYEVCSPSFSLLKLLGGIFIFHWMEDKNPS